MDAIETINYKNYRIEIYVDDDAENPFTEDEGAPTLILHHRAENRFGWTVDPEQWAPRLEYALERIQDHGFIRKLHGPGGALDLVNRWLRVFHGIPVVLPVSAIDHSGVAVYLGSGAHMFDPGGWDSGWIGWLFLTSHQLEEWNCTDATQVEERLRGSFTEFAAWVEGDVLGYQIIDPDGIELDSCWGFYGSDCFTEPDGYALQKCQEIIDDHIHARTTTIEPKGN